MDKKALTEKMQIIKKYSEMLDNVKNSANVKYPTLNKPNQYSRYSGIGYGGWCPLDYVSTARKIFLVEPLLGGALPIYDKDSKISESNSNGSTCKKCNITNEYATPNQPDGSFICYKCRSGY